MTRASVNISCWQDEPVVATLVKRKKVYVLQTLSDGTQKKVELPPHHPYLQNKARQTQSTAGPPLTFTMLETKIRVQIPFFQT